MSPNIYTKALLERGFTIESSGAWHGPFGLTVPNTWNTITTTSLADSARGEVIQQLDAAIRVKQRNFNAK
jgi:hypothetical protein